MTEKVQCKKHGEVSVWLVCRHVGDGKAGVDFFMLL